MSAVIIDLRAERAKRVAKETARQAAENARRFFAFDWLCTDYTSDSFNAWYLRRQDGGPFGVDPTVHYRTRGLDHGDEHE